MVEKGGDVRTRDSELGFTLVELMIVVAIIGILAAVAYPIYQNYVKRTRMSEVVLAVSACRTPISEVYQSGSGTGPGAGNWGCEVSGPSSVYVQSIATDANGKIMAMAQGFNDSAIDGKVLTLVPMIGGAAGNAATDMGKAVTSWRCGSTADGTTIPVNYLPSSCHGS
ncbi:MAG: pilin [Betaproteobacteria bacterium RIFCSPLOWO2_02_67_12]|nr:MAG: pilin [Betaproteobacteria bacterium RIFCSPLOWO2_02_67_12]